MPSSSGERGGAGRAEQPLHVRWRESLEHTRKNRSESPCLFNFGERGGIYGRTKVSVKGKRRLRGNR